MTSQQQYQLINCTHEKTANNCRLCGVFLYDGGQAYKTERYRGEIYNTRYLKSIKKLGIKPLTSKYPFPEGAYSHLERLADKFEFTKETLTLGIYIFNIIYDRYPDFRREYENNMNFYSSVCLMVGAKAIELDKKIPYYSRFQKYADPSHKKEEYEKMQIEILEKLEYNVQIPTFMTFVDYYLSNGVLFTNDLMHKKNAFVIEEKIKELCFRSLKSGDFVLKNQETLAASLVVKARKQSFLPFNPLISKYSLLSASESEQDSILYSNPLPLMNNPNININTNIAPQLTKMKSIQTKVHQTIMPKTKYTHCRSVNSSLGFISTTRNRDL